MSHEQYREICKAVKHARVHLKYLCEKTLQKTEVHMDQLTEQRATENLIHVVKSRNEKPLEHFIMAFINRSENPSMTQSIAHLLLLLAGDATISAVVPFTFHDHILQTCAGIRNDIDIEKNLHAMKQYGVELSDTLHASKLYGFWNECVSFVEYLIDQAIQVHHEDNPVQEPSKIVGSYNPEKGAVYYFTPHGNQVRE